MQLEKLSKTQKKLIEQEQQKVEDLKKAFADAVRATEEKINLPEEILTGEYDAESKTATITVVDDTKKFGDISGTNAMVALDDFAKNDNLVAFQIGNQPKREIAGASAADLKTLILVDTRANFDTETSNLKDYKGKNIEVKVHLEKDGVKAEDTYNIVVK